MFNHTDSNPQSQVNSLQDWRKIDLLNLHDHLPECRQLELLIAQYVEYPVFMREPYYLTDVKAAIEFVSHVFKWSSWQLHFNAGNSTFGLFVPGYPGHYLSENIKIPALALVIGALVCIEAEGELTGDEEETVYPETFDGEGGAK